MNESTGGNNGENESSGNNGENVIVISNCCSSNCPRNSGYLNSVLEFNLFSYFDIFKPSWSRVPERKCRNDIFTIAMKYYQSARNQSAEMTIVLKK